MNLAAPFQKPKLTLPDAEADWLRAAYGAASCILEYGSGGSTALAAEMPGKTVWSVESDAAWVGMMRNWFAANPPPAKVHIHHVDIGKTGPWGFPKGKRNFRRFPQYPLSVWDAPEFAQPDLVLIDGRFRAGCFLATLFRIQAPVTVLFDDYMNRPEYHLVEEFAQRAEHRGRMARFELTPRQVTGDELLAVVEAMSVPE